MAVAAAEAASVPMIALRIVAAVLVVGTAPLQAKAQDRLPEAGVVPADWNAYGHALFEARRHREAIAAYEQAILNSTSHSEEAAWNIARSYAELGNRKQAIRWVEHAIDLGFSDRETIRRAPEFARFRGDPRLDQLLKAMAVSKVRVAMLTSYF